MRIATRWVGWCSILLGTAGALVATSRIWPGDRQRMALTDDVASPEHTWRAFTISDEEAAIAAQACFDRNSGLAAVQRDEDARARLIFVEEDGPIADCLHGARNWQSRAVRSPTGVYFHQRISDGWEPRTDPDLYPPVFWHRCTGSMTPVHVVDARDRQLASLSADAQACIGKSDMAFIDLELRPDGSVGRVGVESVRNLHGRTETRDACITRAMCQYRFERRTKLRHVAVEPRIPF